MSQRPRQAPTSEYDLTVYMCVCVHVFLVSLPNI